MNFVQIIKFMSLQQRDSQYLWHPYTQHKTAAAPIAIPEVKAHYYGMKTENNI